MNHALIKIYDEIDEAFETGKITLGTDMLKKAIEETKDNTAYIYCLNQSMLD